MNEIVSKAFEIARNDLRSCYQKHGIVGGITRLKEYYARNSFFASLGATKLEDYGIVKKNLELFLSLQRSDGMIPVKISANLRPFYGFKFFGEALDQNALFIMALADYVTGTRDTEFLEKNFQKTLNALQWLEKREKNGLVEEGLQSNWSDSILKSGFVLYTNCCYFKAIKDFSFLSSLLGKEEVSEKYAEKSDRVREKINKMFWVGNYYADWVDFSRHEYFSCDGNVLSILWGIADSEQSKMIENKIRQHRLNAVPLKTNYPPYPFWRVMWLLLPMHAYHYHNGASWLWLGAINVLSLKIMGWTQEARAETNEMSKLIVENATVPEVFDSQKPFSSVLLKSEVHFSWSAGLFVKAVMEK